MPVVKASETCFNKMKSIGTHNSYHLAPQTEILEILKSSLVRPRLPADAYLPEGTETSLVAVVASDIFCN